MNKKDIDYCAGTEYDWSLFSVEDYKLYKEVLELYPYDPNIAEFFHEQKKIQSRQEKQAARFYAKTDVEALEAIPAEEDYEISDFYDSILCILTDIERRRLNALISGYTEVQIAEKEGCTLQAVNCSIMHARKKVKNLLSQT